MRVDGLEKVIEEREPLVEHSSLLKPKGNPYGGVSG